MGLFGRRFLKEGKGVSKDDAAKRNYLETLIGKFWDLVKLNLLYIACNIPVIIISLLIAITLWFDENNLIFYFEEFQKGNILVMFWLFLPLLPLVLSGPFTAGLTYVVRNYTKREHVFLFSDFFEHSKSNIKQSILMNLISFVVLYLYFTAFGFYYFVMFPGSLSIVGIFGIIGLVLAIMNFYTFPMIVSFDLKLRNIIKNAWIFALAKLPQNLFFLIIIIAVHVGAIFFYSSWILLIILILISWTGFTINYYAWHVIEKLMLPPSDKNNEDIKVFDDTKGKY